MWRPLLRSAAIVVILLAAASVTLTNSAHAATRHKGKQGKHKAHSTKAKPAAAEDEFKPPPPMKLTAALTYFEAGATKGQPLVWRTLATFPTPPAGWSRSNPSSDNQVFVGKLQPGKDEQVLADIGGWRIFHVDGTSETLAIPDAKYQDEHWPYSIDALWDFDGDGLDDIVSSQSPDEDLANSTGPPRNAIWAISLAGKPLGLIAFYASSYHPKICDLDGDGSSDLLLEDAERFVSSNSWRGFAKHGREILSTGTWGPFHITVADVDGDGRTELIGVTRHGIEYMGIGKPPGPLPPGLKKWSRELDSPYSPAVSLENSEDIIVGYDGEYLNLKHGYLQRLEVPAGYMSGMGWFENQMGSQLRMSFSTIGAQPMVCLHKPSTRLVGIITPRDEFAHIGRVGPMEFDQPETLAIWDKDGNLQYSENLGEWASSVFALHAADGDRIVLPTRSRLLIWP